MRIGRSVLAQDEEPLEVLRAELVDLILVLHNRREALLAQLPLVHLLLHGAWGDGEGEGASAGEDQGSGSGLRVQSRARANARSEAEAAPSTDLGRGLGGSAQASQGEVRESREHTRRKEAVGVAFPLLAIAPAARRGL